MKLKLFINKKMYRRLFINNNGATVSPDRGDVLFNFIEPIIIKDDEVLEMRISLVFDKRFWKFCCLCVYR